MIAWRILRLMELREEIQKLDPTDALFGQRLAMLNAQLQLVASEIDRELIELEKRVRR